MNTLTDAIFFFLEKHVSQDVFLVKITNVGTKQSHQQLLKPPDLQSHLHSTRNPQNGPLGATAKEPSISNGRSCDVAMYIASPHTILFLFPSQETPLLRN